MQHQCEDKVNLYQSNNGGIYGITAARRRYKVNAVMYKNGNNKKYVPKVNKTDE